MPHISHYSLNGIRLPSVSAITDTLKKEGIMRWYRRVGFAECDRISKESKEQGNTVASMFEWYRKEKKKPRDKYLKRVLNEWYEWGEGWSGIKLVPEPHLVNTIDLYHGSPDLVFHDTKWVLGDDKNKKRFADYGLLMNEHAYAMCNKIHNVETGELTDVPWEVPLRDIWFWTYCPDCGKLYPQYHKFDRNVYRDFLICRQMYRINKTADKYFDDNAVLLPGECHEKA